VTLPAPAYEQQTMNNCGPASLAMVLRFYGWDGKQADIASLIKPLDDDRNVNVEELVYYVRNRAGWLKAEFRVGGSLDLLKRLMAAGLPVMVEESFYIDQPFWPNDDLWAAHYLLLTGYDDASQTFTGQDSFHGADQKVAYATLDNYWHIFNRVYILVYRPEQEEAVKSILGGDWDPNLNRQHALATAQAEAQSNPRDAFAWFNVGSNLVFFGRYAEAASTYDTARNLGLPQRMLRYQFGPFFAYFHSGRTEDLLALTEYALQRTLNAEEALLWHGWALYRKGDTAGAAADFRKALKANPNGQDAKNALNFVGASP
jgi:tetratricopeptide (TPR) repeat protein